MSCYKTRVDASPPRTAFATAGLALVAGALHGGADWLSLRLPAAAPPHLLLSYGPEFLGLLPLGAVSFAYSVVSGLVAALLVRALAPSLPAGAPKRILLMGSVLWIAWALSAVLLAQVWLSVPWGRVLASLAYGLPRNFLVAACLTGLVQERAEPRSSPPAP